jgi:hypothetical protein
VYRWGMGRVGVGDVEVGIRGNIFLLQKMPCFSFVGEFTYYYKDILYKYM